MLDSESGEGRLQPLQEISTRISQHSSNGAPVRREKTLSQFSAIVRIISNQDAESRYRTEEADNGIQPGGESHRISIHDTTGEKIVSWEPDDKENPYNWSNVCAI